MADETIRCPSCQFECKAWATVCASCMVEFKKWLEANPGSSITGWKPGQRPITPAASTSEPLLDPIDVSPTAEGAKSGGIILVVIACFQILVSFLVGFVTENEEEQATLRLGCFVAAFIFGALSVGAFKGKKICIWLGLALIVLDWVFTIATNPTMAVRGVILKAYFVYALYKAATA
jgi:hypothetical protein